MAQITLIKTAGAVDANAYCDEDEAKVFLEENRLHSSEWAALSSNNQRAALIWATRMLDVSFDWRGTKRTIAQALRFPRVGLVDSDGYTLDYDTIPVLLKVATSELAATLAHADPTGVPEIFGKGIRRAKLGPMEIEVDELQAPQTIPNYVISLLEPFGSLKGVANLSGDRVVRLVRA